MKKLVIIFSLFFVLCSTTSQAQEVYYVANGSSLEMLDNDVVAVSFIATKIFSRNLYMQINHGQDCMNRLVLQNRLEYLRNCSGLLDSNGNLVEVANYMKGLDLMEKNGWQLVTVAVDTDSEGGSSPESHQYIFRRNSDLN